MPLGPNFGGQISGTGKSKGGGSNAQIFPARVKDIILQPSTDPNSLFALNAGYTSIAYISFHPLKSVVDTPNQSNLIASPLDINLRRVPLLNEVVLIMSSTDVMNEDQLAQKYYYISGISIWNSVHHNGFPDLQYLGATQKSTNIVGYQSSQDGIVKKQDDAPKDLYLGNTFIENPEIRNLFPVEGDVIVEGRFGNSMRLSHTSKFPSQSVTSPWSNYGSNTRPITIIRNGQTKQVPAVKWTPIFESIDGDASSIYLTNGQEIQMTLASRNLLSYGTTVTASSVVVQVPNVLIQPQNVALIKSDDSELQTAISQSTQSTPLNITKTVVTSSVSSSAETISNNSSIVTTDPTSSVDSVVEKKVTSGPGSSKVQAIPESQLGSLSWLGEEIIPLDYNQEYAQEDETQFWSKNPQPIEIPAEVTRILAPPTPPPPPPSNNNNSPAGSPPGTYNANNLTFLNPAPYKPSEEQLKKAAAAAKAGLDLLPDKGYVDNGGKKIILAYMMDEKAGVVDTVQAFIVMSAAAKLEGITLKVYSAFRPPFASIEAVSQKGFKVRMTGQWECRGAGKGYKPKQCGPWTTKIRDTAASSCWHPVVAPPGSSQHGWGRALDIVTTNPPYYGAVNPPSSKLSEEYTWLAWNAHKYGFVRSVQSEVWHWEYWGNEARKLGPYWKVPKGNYSWNHVMTLNKKQYDLKNIPL